MSLTGEPDGHPVRMGLPMGDLTGGIIGALAVAAALFRRQITGQGAHVDLSLLDCQASLLTYLAQYFWTDGRVPGPQGSQHESVVPYQALATRDGHVIVAVFEKFWGGFCRAAGHPEWEQRSALRHQPRPRGHREALMPLIEASFAGRTTDEWLARLTAEDVPAAPIQTVDGVLTDPQLQARQMVVDMRHPRHGAIPPWARRQGRRPDGARGRAAAGAGRAQRRVLRELLNIPASGSPSCARGSDRVMRVTVLGGGHGAYAMAADLGLAGHDVRLWRRTGASWWRCALRAASPSSSKTGAARRC